MLILQDIRLSQLNRLNRRGIACVAGAFELSREICVRKYSGRSNGIAFDSDSGLMARMHGALCEPDH
jgi:hypothetical protein